MAAFTHTIVAGVSNPAADDPSLLAAIEIARASGAALHLVHAYELPPLLPAAAGFELGFPEGEAAYQASLLAVLQAGARRVPGGERAECHVVLGQPGPTLARVAQQTGAGLVVVGAARASRLRQAFLGTVAQRVLRAAHVPVLVARRPVARPPERVLLTTDLSPLSAAVHDTALETIAAFLGRPRKVRSLLVLGWKESPPPLPEGAIETAGHVYLERFLAGRAWAERVEPAVRMGYEADNIVAEARGWGADLLVVGTHARRWGARMMLGSVAEAALREAPCNVLAVPPLPVPAAASPAREPAGAALAGAGAP